MFITVYYIGGFFDNMSPIKPFPLSTMDNKNPQSLALDQETLAADFHRKKQIFIHIAL